MSNSPKPESPEEKAKRVEYYRLLAARIGSAFGSASDKEKEALLRQIKQQHEQLENATELLTPSDKELAEQIEKIRRESAQHAHFNSHHKTSKLGGKSRRRNKKGKKKTNKRRRRN